MTGAPELMNFRAKPLGTATRQALERGGAKGAPDPGATFEALLTRVGTSPKRNRQVAQESEKQSDAAIIAESVALTPSPLPVLGDGEPTAMPAGAAGRDRATITVRAAAVQSSEALTKEVAGQLVRALSPRAASAPGKNGAFPGFGAKDVGEAPRAERGSEAPASSRIGGATPNSSKAISTDVQVMRREVHFGPATPGAAAVGPSDRVGTSETVSDGGARADFESGRGSKTAPRAGAAANRAAAASGMPAGQPATLQARAGPEEAKAAGPDPAAASARASAVESAPAAQSPFGPGRGSEVAGTVQAFSAAPAGAPQTQPAIAPGQVKVLQIQLQPAELGMLEVRMTLTDAGLELHIEASRQETLALLKSDRDTLAGVLRAAGHALDSVTVTLSDKSGSQTQASQQDASASWGQGARPDAQPGSPRDGGGHSAERFAAAWTGESAIEQGQDEQDRPALAARRGGDVYL